jgi:hypothetical protein
MGGVLALLIGALKLGKVGGTLITMLISLAVYSMAYGWCFAIGFNGLLFAHEIGHFLAAMRAQAIEQNRRVATPSSFRRIVPRTDRPRRAGILWRRRAVRAPAQPIQKYVERRKRRGGR